MGAGSLRSRVTFGKRADATDDYGNTQTDFVDQFTVWAQVTPRLGGEAVMAARLEGRQPLTIRVRQSAETKQIATDWRAKDARSGNVFNIRSIIDPSSDKSGAGQWFDILVEAGVAT